MDLTPEVLAAAYEYLRATPPFKAWKLPHADEVEFSVTKHRDHEGGHTTYCNKPNEHIIYVSSYYIKSTPDLMECLGHEMIHMRQDLTKTGGKVRAKHNAEFNKLNARFCKLHGLETEVFS